MEIELLKKLHRQSLSTEELERMYRENRDRYRVVLALIQKRNFPVNLALEVIPRLYTPDLIQVIRNSVTNPQVRKRGELEFLVKYRKMPSGERVSLIKRAPPELLGQLLMEEDSKILNQIFQAPLCTSSVVFRFLLQGKARKHIIYSALTGTRWVKERDIADFVIDDAQSPLRIQIEVLKLLSNSKLREITSGDAYHSTVVREAYRVFQRRMEEE